MRRWEFARLLCRAAARLCVIGIAICITISTPLSHAEGVLFQSTAAHDLQSIIDAKRLRVAVTRFDLPSFHTHRPDGALVGAEIEMAQQIGRALGVAVEFIEDADSFDAVVDLVASGRAAKRNIKLNQTKPPLVLLRFL
jgi:ABC-type amino acid transport substrate-binding protein